MQNEAASPCADGRGIPWLYGGKWRPIRVRQPIHEVSNRGCGQTGVVMLLQYALWPDPGRHCRYRESVPATPAPPRVLLHARWQTRPLRKPRHPRGRLLLRYDAPWRRLRASVLLVAIDFPRRSKPGSTASGRASKKRWRDAIRRMGYGGRSGRRCNGFPTLRNSNGG